MELVKCNLVYISFDGIPTFSKILEQKIIRTGLSVIIAWEAMSFADSTLIKCHFRRL